MRSVGSKDASISEGRSRARRSNEHIPCRNGLYDCAHQEYAGAYLLAPYIQCDRRLKTRMADRHPTRATGKSYASPVAEPHPARTGGASRPYSEVFRGRRPAYSDGPWMQNESSRCGPPHCFPFGEQLVSSEIRPNKEGWSQDLDISVRQGSGSLIPRKGRVWIDDMGAILIRRCRLKSPLRSPVAQKRPDCLRSVTCRHRLPSSDTAQDALGSGIRSQPSYESCR